MMNLIKNFYNTPEKKRIIENFISLSSLQAVDYILPLITLPYLLRVLGPEKYGLVSFAYAFILYFSLISDYGFNLSATREISINRENTAKKNEIFSSVMAVKLILMTGGFLIMNIIVFSFAKFSNDWLAYLLSFGIVIGNTLFPLWFFQGIEKMKYITILNIIAKTVFTICIFIFIRNETDYLLVPLLNSLGFIISGILGLVIVFAKFKIKIVFPNTHLIKYQFIEGWHVFISTISISLYTVSNTFILGLFTSNIIVGYFSVAEKITKAAQGVFAPISQAVYPYISKLVMESKEKALIFIKKIILIMGGLAAFITLFLFVLAEPIITFLSGSEYLPAIGVLKIISFLPFLIALSNIFGIQIMLNFGLKKAFSRILISAGLVNIVLSLILVPLWQEKGTSLAVLISEIFVTLAMFIVLEKKGIQAWKGKLI